MANSLALFARSLSLSAYLVTSSEIPRHHRAAPPRGPAAPAPLLRSQRAHRSRRIPRIAPLPSAKPPVHRSAASVNLAGIGHGAAAAVCPPAACASATHLGPPWTRWSSAAVLIHWRAMDPPLMRRHVAGRIGHPRRPWQFCKKALVVFRNKPTIMSNSNIIRIRSWF